MENLLKRSKKMNNLTKGIARAKKIRKREEAEARQKRYDSLSLTEKLARSTPGSKENLKLSKKLKGSKV